MHKRTSFWRSRWAWIGLVVSLAVPPFILKLSYQFDALAPYDEAARFVRDWDQNKPHEVVDLCGPSLSRILEALEASQYQVYDLRVGYAGFADAPVLRHRVQENQRIYEELAHLPDTVEEWPIEDSGDGPLGHFHYLQADAWAVLDASNGDWQKAIDELRTIAKWGQYRSADREFHFEIQPNVMQFLSGAEAMMPRSRTIEDCEHAVELLEEVLKRPIITKADPFLGQTAFNAGKSRSLNPNAILLAREGAAQRLNPVPRQINWEISRDVTSPGGTQSPMNFSDNGLVPWTRYIRIKAMLSEIAEEELNHIDTSILPRGVMKDSSVSDAVLTQLYWEGWIGGTVYSSPIFSRHGRVIQAGYAVRAYYHEHGEWPISVEDIEPRLWPTDPRPISPSNGEELLGPIPDTISSEPVGYTRVPLDEKLARFLHARLMIPFRMSRSWPDVAMIQEDPDVRLSEEGIAIVEFSLGVLRPVALTYLIAGRQSLLSTPGGIVSGLELIDNSGKRIPEKQLGEWARADKFYSSAVTCKVRLEFSAPDGVPIVWAERGKTEVRTYSDRAEQDFAPIKNAVIVLPSGL